LAILGKLFEQYFFCGGVFLCGQILQSEVYNLGVHNLDISEIFQKILKSKTLRGKELLNTLGLKDFIRRLSLES